jgi:hypothetical protein
LQCAHRVERCHFGAQELAVFAAGCGDGFHHSLHEGLDSAVVAQALAIDENLARLRAFFVVEHHGRVQGVDQMWERVRIGINHVLLAAVGRLAEDRARLLGHELLFADHILFQVQPQGEGQLACLVGGELLGAEGVPGHQIPIGDRIELDRAAQQQPLLTQIDDLFAGQVERLARLERQRIASLRIGLAGQHRPVLGDNRQHRAERADVKINAFDALLLKLGRLLSCGLADPALKILPPHGLR